MSEIDRCYIHLNAAYLAFSAGNYAQSHRELAEARTVYHAKPRGVPPRGVWCDAFDDIVILRGKLANIEEQRKNPMRRNHHLLAGSFASGKVRVIRPFGLRKSGEDLYLVDGKTLKQIRKNTGNYTPSLFGSTKYAFGKKDERRVIGKIIRNARKLKAELDDEDGEGGTVKRIESGLKADLDYLDSHVSKSRGYAIIRGILGRSLESENAKFISNDLYRKLAQIKRKPVSALQGEVKKGTKPDMMNKVVVLVSPKRTQTVTVYARKDGHWNTLDGRPVPPKTLLFKNVYDAHAYMKEHNIAGFQEQLARRGKARILGAT